ncbi:MAG TPA: AbrB/MazE/SpoVT family DNA-binding domain-containing protein [Anaerolineales bacterium]|jgi:bifunctional DNA-binding transcriptional regulator/antitoxin component of YhaV-PrlF toxin-antitoxin module|nr:AbrB/MazE/SpoVT family DNA-binding domain-containing protein [Anaerolineales bacterium]HQX15017.1 AbrB/MazE/SpoVT family DNA-binding domain-containing protein [Anaerolineales bacterium]
MATTIQIRKEGTISLPVEFRDKYGLEEGEALNLIDLGNGSFLLSPRRSRIDELADTIRTDLESHGESLESMLKTLREVRAEYAAKNS